MKIYDELLKEVLEGNNFYINFIERKLKIGNRVLIKEGEWDRENNLGVEKVCLTDCLKNIERLYQEYRDSVPNKRSETRYKKYFKPLSFEEIPEENIFSGGVSRDYAQAKLEGYILCSILNGSLYWDENLMGKWFWKSKIYPELIILKQWIN